MALIQLKYSTVYDFPGNYKWQDFTQEGVYIFLTDKRQVTDGSSNRTVFIPLYVGQSAQIGPEILSHYRQTTNVRLRTAFAQRTNNLFVVYAAVKGEAGRLAAEAFLIKTYFQRGFVLCNEQRPEPPLGFEVNVF